MERLGRVTRADILVLQPLTKLTSITLLALATAPHHDLPHHHAHLQQQAAQQLNNNNNNNNQQQQGADDEEGPEDGLVGAVVAAGAAGGAGAGGNLNAAVAAAAGAGGDGQSAAIQAQQRQRRWQQQHVDFAVGGVLTPLEQLPELRKLVVGTVGGASGGRNLSGDSGKMVTAYVCPPAWEHLSLLKVRVPCMSRV